MAASEMTEGANGGPECGKSAESESEIDEIGHETPPCEFASRIAPVSVNPPFRTIGVRVKPV